LISDRLWLAQYLKAQLLSSLPESIGYDPLCIGDLAIPARLTPSSGERNPVADRVLDLSAWME